MATLYDVCRKTGLSTATVSRVINNSGLVKESTRERVRQAMEELNYRPSHAARMLAGRKTDTVGLILPVIDNGYYVRVLRGIDHVATEEDLKLLISFYHSDKDLMENLSALGREGRTDAIILMNNTFLNAGQVRKLTGSTHPIALIGQEHDAVKGIDSILVNNFHGACSATRLLLQTRPRSLLLLTGPADNHDSRERLRGAEAAIGESGLTVNVTVLNGDFYHEGGRKVFENYLSSGGTVPDAVFAFNDAMALGVLDVLNDGGHRIPEDVQVVGFDNTEIAQYIGLSTVRVPMQQIGEEACRLVAKRIKDTESGPTTMTLETSLISRRTTRP